MRTATVLGLVVGISLPVAACHHGRDTGPKKPKPQGQFLPLVDQFAKKTETCIGDVFQVSLKRDITAAERADKTKVGKAVGELRKELLQCLTGEGYGNEIQIQRSVVEVWLAKKGCPQFAKAAFTASQCSAIGLLLEDVGYTAGTGSPPRTPPKKKKRPSAPPPRGK